MRLLVEEEVYLIQHEISILSNVPVFCLADPLYKVEVREDPRSGLLLWCR